MSQGQFLYNEDYILKILMKLFQMRKKIDFLVLKRLKYIK